jgi:outer membrane protein
MRTHALRSTLAAGASFCCLAWASSARAQFANHSIGFEAGYLFIDSGVQAGSGPDIGLEATLYLDSGFELYFRVLVGLHENLAVTPPQKAVGIFPALGVRYLFSEEQLRPYVGLSVAYMHFFGDNLPGALFGVSPNAGLEYFFQANTALGLQAEYHRILALNEPGANAFALVAKIAWSF